MEELGADWLSELRATSKRLNRGKAQRLLLLMLIDAEKIVFLRSRQEQIPRAWFSLAQVTHPE